MAPDGFSKDEAVRFGWDTMKSNIGFFIATLILAGFIDYGPGVIARSLEEDSPVLSLVIDIAGFVLSMVVAMGLIRIALGFCDNKNGDFGDLFSCFPLFFKYLVGSILYGLIILGGLMLLIIPGIIWAIKFQFYGYFIIDKGIGPIEALKSSSTITTDVKWDLFVFGLILTGINLLGLLALLIGLFATIPTSMVAMAFVYRKLLEQSRIGARPGEYSGDRIVSSNSS